jgi:hypothetical protein
LIGKRILRKGIFSLFSSLPNPYFYTFLFQNGAIYLCNYPLSKNRAKHSFKKIASPKKIGVFGSNFS